MDWSGECETPVGSAGKLRLHRRFWPRTLDSRLRKASSMDWSGNLPFIKNNKVYVFKFITAKKGVKEGFSFLQNGFIIQIVS